MTIAVFAVQSISRMPQVKQLFTGGPLATKGFKVADESVADAEAEVEKKEGELG